MLYNSIIIINAIETEKLKTQQMKQHKVLNVDRRPCSDSRHVTAPYKLSFFIIIIIIILTSYGLPKNRKKDQSAAYYSCEKTRLAVYITSRITPRGVKLEVIYRTNQTYS